jgi:hypothetical protein
VLRLITTIAQRERHEHEHDRGDREQRKHQNGAAAELIHERPRDPVPTRARRGPNPQITIRTCAEASIPRPRA